MVEGGSSDDSRLEQALHRARVLEEPPDDVLIRAIGLFTPQQAAAGPAALDAAVALWKGLRRRMATRISDTGFVPAMALGVRSGGNSVLRHVVDAGDPHDVDLRIEPDAQDSQAWTIAGQLLGPEWLGRLLLCDEFGETRAAVRLDAGGEFRLDAVPPGRWQIVLVHDTEALELPPLDLPRREPRAP